MVSCESTNSSQRGTLYMTMFTGIAGTALYPWAVREEAAGWWGISPLEGCCSAVRG